MLTQLWTSLRPHWKNLCYLVRHKAWLAYAGWKLGVPFDRLFWHDLSKLWPDEWFPYTRFFYKTPSSNRDKASALWHFKHAWAKHVRRNRHHPEHWNGGEMPETYVREMVADWFAAGMAQGKPDIVGWFEQSKFPQYLPPQTLKLVQQLLLEVSQWPILLQHTPPPTSWRS